MKIEYVHASKYGNGAAVAAEFAKRMTARGATVDVHHIRDASPRQLPPADLYLFSSPGRMGRPIGGMRRFLRKVDLTAGTKYAVLQGKGLVTVAEDKVLVTGMKGPLEDGWQDKVEAFASRLPNG